MRLIRRRAAAEYGSMNHSPVAGMDDSGWKQCDQPRMMELTKEKMTCMAFSL